MEFNKTAARSKVFFHDEKTILPLCQLQKRKIDGFSALTTYSPYHSGGLSEVLKASMETPQQVAHCMCFLDAKLTYYPQMVVLAHDPRNKADNLFLMCSIGNDSRGKLSVYNWP